MRSRDRMTLFVCSLCLLNDATVPGYETTSGTLPQCALCFACACKFCRRTPPPTFSDTAIIDRHSDTTFSSSEHTGCGYRWQVVSRQVFTPYDCLLLSVAFVVLCHVGCLWLTGVYMLPK